MAIHVLLAVCSDPMYSSECVCDASVPTAFDQCLCSRLRDVGRAVHFESIVVPVSSSGGGKRFYLS